jgi:hypothetical protein
MSQSIDLVGNYVLLVIFFVAMYLMGFNWVRGNKEDTEYTKNVKLNRRRKILLCFFFYKDDKIEMEAVIHQIANYIITTILAVVCLYVEIEPKTFFIIYVSASLLIIVGCLVYRFIKKDFKESKDHYE